MEINVDEGTWRDHRTGEGGGIYSLLVKLLGSGRAAPGSGSPTRTPFPGQD